MYMVCTSNSLLEFGGLKYCGAMFFAKSHFAMESQPDVGPPSSMDSVSIKRICPSRYI